MSETEQRGRAETGTTGVLCALPEELGSLPERVRGIRRPQGLELLELDASDHRVLACVAGIGKVRAARAAAILIGEGASRLLVVGTCGGLRSHLEPGTLVVCRRAIQADLSIRDGREVDADVEILSAWQRETGAEVALFLTADRPVVSFWRRARLLRGYVGDCVADMETAAVAAVGEAAGVPWGALRAVTDRADSSSHAAFRVHYPVQAGRAADTVPGLLSRLGPPRRSLEGLPDDSQTR